LSYREPEEKYAVITGASMGLGREMAFELAGRGFNLLLVSLQNEDLEEVCSEVKKKGVKADFFETDLTIKNNLLELTGHIKNNYNVNILVNNAGIGGSSEFEKTGVSYIEKIINLNIRATVLIIHQLLPDLKKNAPSYILNVSSMAAFSPIGYKTIYPASKAFINHFTKGLNEELKGTGVSASVVNPGPMRTNEYVTGRINKHGTLGKMGVESPGKVANIAISKMFKHRGSFSASWPNRFSLFAIRLLPSGLTLPVLTRAMKKDAGEQKKTPQGN